MTLLGLILTLAGMALAWRYGTPRGEFRAPPRNPKLGRFGAGLALAGVALQIWAHYG
jgi:hypothetical protein